MENLSPSTSFAWTPFRIAPFFSERVWGISDLHPWYDQVAAGDPIGEAWLTGDQCVIASGLHAGKTLGALFADEPEELLGKAAPCNDGSPLLIKVLFVREKLSVQVHPDDRDGAKIWRTTRQDGVLVRAGGGTGRAGCLWTQAGRLAE